MGKPKKKKPKRKPSPYNKHVGHEMRAGKTMKQAAASWKRKGSKPKSRASTSRRSNPTGGTRRMPKFDTRKLFSAVRMISLVAPGVITAMGSETPQRKGEIILAKYTGVSPDGTFRLADLRQGYEPFFWTSLVTYGIPKLVSFVKGLLG